MTDEDVVDCILEIDATVAHALSALDAHNIALAVAKLKQARDAIEDLRAQHCADNDPEVEMDVMNKLK